jgi:4-amino-4-deoxy-L-arabinose transferase-like glycosyltransferase
MNDTWRDPLTRYAVVAFLLVLFALLSFGARQLSFTFDEPSHITAGYTFLARGATWMVPLHGHPPLVEAWEALPLYLADPDIPLETLDGWNQDYFRYVEAFAPLLTHDAMERSEVAGRTPAMLLTVLLAAVVCRWGVDLWGEGAGLLALGILIFDPTLLAHGRLATNDVGATSLGMLGLYLIWRWEQAPYWKRSAAAGLILGLTMMAKGSGILWVAVGAGWAMWIGLRQCGKARLQVLFMGTLSLLVVWSMYGFAVGTIPGWPPIPVPAPRHWRGLFFHTGPLAQYVVFGSSDLLGTARWPRYLPLAFLIKNPLPLLIALPLAAHTLLGERRRWQRLRLLGLFLALYVDMIIALGPSIAPRHAFPIHPLLYLLIGGSVGRIWRRLPGVGRWGIVALGIWYVAGTMRVYPYNLTFFNEIAGGPENGWRYLADSNTDWGQGWKALRSFREEKSLTFSFSGLEGYDGLAPYELWEKPLPPLRRVYEPLFKPWLFPEPGDYVISANTLNGLWLADRDNFAWFRYHTPDAVVAHILFYYHVDSALAPIWVAQCHVPTTPLDEDAMAEGFGGQVAPRFVAFDCTQSWIYPDHGDTRGVYALHGAFLQPATLKEWLYLAPSRPTDAFAARHLRDVPMAFRQWEYRDLPAFALYEWEGSSLPTLPTLEVGVAPADMPPTALASDAFHTAPLPLSGPITFLGAATCSQEETLEVETWWQVTEGPITRPCSITAHLLAEDGAVLSVADGLGVSPLALASSDVVVQRHRFLMPPKGTKAWLQTGAYWLDTGERWPVSGMPEDNALFVLLEGE